MPRCHVPVPNHLDTVLETELGDGEGAERAEKSIFVCAESAKPFSSLLNEKKQKSKI
jgi:hypothetical protein